MKELTKEQQQALDHSPHIPARVTNPVNRTQEVLLRADDFEWIRELLSDKPDAPRQIDARTGVVYAVLPEERYERFKAFFEEDPLTASEKMALLREAGRRGGWHDPVWRSPEAS